MGKEYLVIVQCHIVKEQCSGYLCEMSFTKRRGRFSDYAEQSPARMLSITCGGCTGRAVHRKLMGFLKTIKRAEGIEKDQVQVHLSSCITNDSFHGLPCPHLDYLKTIINEKLGLDLAYGTFISDTAEKRRAEGRYKSLPGNEKKT